MIGYVLTFLGFFIPISIISLVSYSLIENNHPVSKNLSVVDYKMPFLLDPKAVLKANYINVSNYGPYLIAKCIESKLKNCSNPSIYITSYVYLNANPEFCSKVKAPFKVNNYIVKNKQEVEQIKELCDIFYKVKNHNLTEKDCIGPLATEICSFYLENPEDFIKSNLQYLMLEKNPEFNNCLSLEKDPAYYCLKIKNISCDSFEDEKEREKCYELKVIPSKEYSKFLEKVKYLLSKNDWKDIEKLVQKASTPERLHTLARLGTINLTYCKVFLNKSLKQYKYCLQKYYNQRFMCDYSPDGRECKFFDVLLNNKSCELLADPQEKTDCELFKKYFGKKDCNFFYTVGTNEYLGYLCAIKSKNCNGQWYYDKMYQVVCQQLVSKK